MSAQDCHHDHVAFITLSSLYSNYSHPLFASSADQKQSHDPNRFTNRGGQLQKQLKLRKQLEKELPKVEKQLKAVLLQWEEDHERYFVVSDTRYLDTMEYQMKERSQEREQEKIKKVILLMCGPV